MAVVGFSSSTAIKPHTGGEFSQLNSYGEHRPKRRVQNDVFIHSKAHGFPYERQLANEFQLLRSENIRLGATNPSDFNITNISPLIINNDEIVTITVKARVGKLSIYDWIGAYSPANADIRKSVPVKFTYCNVNSSYLVNGIASFTFNFTNLRSDIAFYLFTGNLTYPYVMDKYPETVKFANPNEQLRPRVVATGDPDTLNLVWSSYDTTLPILIWGVQSGAYSVTEKAITSNLQRSKMCGNPANSTGWFDLGLIHTAPFKGLSKLNSLYIYYRFGVTNDLSKEYRLRLPPQPGKQPPDRPTTVILYDDMGRGSLDMSYTWNEYGRPSLYTAMAVGAEVANGGVDAVYHGGDISYATGYLAVWDFFLDMISPIASGAIYLTIVGNHESDWPYSASFYYGTDSGGECGWATTTLIPLPAPAQTNTPWWSYNVGLIHFVGLSTEHNYTTGSPQWLWLQNDLANVNRDITPWVIFGGHRAMYLNSDYNSGFSSDGETSALLIKHVEPLLYEYKVDLGFYGHNHVVQRQSAVYQSKVVQRSKATIDSDGNTWYAFTDPNATVHMVIGTAGAMFTKNAIDPPPEWNELYFYEYGYARVTAVSASELRWEWINSESNEIMDRMIITQSSRATTSGSADDNGLSVGEEAAIAVISIICFATISWFIYYNYYAKKYVDNSSASTNLIYDDSVSDVYGPRK